MIPGIINSSFYAVTFEFSAALGQCYAAWDWHFKGMIDRQKGWVSSHWVHY